jgi:putative ABC transport system permease protein
LTEDANASAVENELQEEYPSYTIRTNREQLQATLQEKITLIASGLSLVILAVVAGILLTMNLQLSFVYQRRESYAALQALGTSTSSLVVLTLTNTLLIGLLGGALGVVLAFPSTWILNWIAVTVSGFENVV